MFYKQNRILIFLSVIVLGFLLYSTWQQENYTEELAKNKVVNESIKQDIQELDKKTQIKINKKNLINFENNVLKILINPIGGDIVQALLKKFPSTLNSPEPVKLLNYTPEYFYIVQSGLVSNTGPDLPEQQGRATYEIKKNLPNQIVLTTTLKNGIEIEKYFEFASNDKYEINVKYNIVNNSGEIYSPQFYGQIKKNKNIVLDKSFFMMRAFSGIALNTDKKPFLKIQFDELNKKTITEEKLGGWAAMVDHYFLTAWIPNPNQENIFQALAQTQEKDIYIARFIQKENIILPNSSKQLEAKLYIGPENTYELERLSPGLELTADYGILWPICKPIFWLMQKIYEIVGNWGVAIIIITILIKLAFYKLSAASYKSMAKMRTLQPRLEQLKKQYGDDKKQMGEAMMRIYKEEKINPIGGCLPLLIQIPVFIALYYVLLSSVELRQAPFMLWIQDLSSKDPYYILPIAMGVAMYFQQKLNPAPTDPVQAKMMMFMPVIFTFLFLQFPSGLVLYWLVNTLLSILQQWLITRQMTQ